MVVGLGGGSLRLGAQWFSSSVVPIGLRVHFERCADGPKRDLDGLSADFLAAASITLPDPVSKPSEGSDFVLGGGFGEVGVHTKVGCEGAPMVPVAACFMVIRRHDPIV